MKEQDVKAIQSQLQELDPSQKVELIETHISWLLLTGQHVYKIKKKVKFSFLDFSTLEKRHYFCQEELKLNRRLAPQIYLAVQAIYRDGKQWRIGEAKGNLVDYCVQMRRVPAHFEMLGMMYREEVRDNHMHQLAKILADFHQNTKKLDQALTKQFLIEEFSDLVSQRSFIEQSLGAEAIEVLDAAVEYSQDFWSRYYDRYRWRVANGYRCDGHGDLHIGNIFLTDSPIIFDCIEFNPAFRQIDIINELAFFSMDLERFGRQDLAEIFLETYQSHLSCIHNQEDKALFHYYKMYRANVKAKVNAIKAQQATSAEMANKRSLLCQQYLRLLESYLVDTNV